MLSLPNDLLQFNNFGLDPLMLLDKVGMRETAFRLFNIDASHIEMSPTKVSYILAWLSSEVGEPVRIPLTIYLSPKLRKMLDDHKAKRTGLPPAPPTPPSSSS